MSAASSGELISWPGSVGTPAAAARSRALTLSPATASTSAGGPTKVIPFSRARAASRGFSEMKP